MSHENEAILSKLYTNGYSHVIFDTLKSTVLRYSIIWINLMYLSLGSIPNFQLHKNMPDTHKRIYPVIRCIIDCTELFCARSSSPLKVLFIQAKRHVTLKGLVGIVPSGIVTFISCT